MKRWLCTTIYTAIAIPCLFAADPAGDSGNSVNIKLAGANPFSSAVPPGKATTPSCFFDREYQAKMQLSAPPAPKTFYKNVYPGIDLTCYGDEYQLEYVFTVAPGADPGLIKLLFQNARGVSMTHTGGIRILIPGGEVIQSPPTVFLESGKSLRKSDGIYEMGYGGAFSINPGSAFNEQTKKMNDTRFCLVPSGGQPGGPNYDFYMSKQEVSNDQFMQFLNNAEVNRKNARGSNMFFDTLGNVWKSPERIRGRDEMFEIAGSQLSYDVDKPAGSRYIHWRTKEKKTPYAKHPVTGLSWFGAVKYCNWLTIESGRSEAECCYREGTNSLDWAPVTATNWAGGTFDDAERQAWISTKGFRLPMLNCRTESIATNRFNEFYKAASWWAYTNRLYGFGRDSFDGTDANFRDTIGKVNEKTFPAGYFNGEHNLGGRQTRPNENFYGIFDLSGNVAEWVNDFGETGNPYTRAVCGGSWEDAPTPLAAGKTVPACSTSTFGGFRINTTYLPVDSMRIHILYSFFMEPPRAAQQPKSEEFLPFSVAPIQPPMPTPSIPLEIKPSEKQGGPSIDINAPRRLSDGIIPDGITYKPGARQIPPVPATVPTAAGPTAEPVVMPQAVSHGGSVTPPPGPVTTNFILSIAANTPDPPVSINVNPADNGGNTSGNTPFTRTYSPGTVVALSAPMDSGTADFQQWLLNGVFHTTNRNTTVTMTANASLTAIYVARITTNRVLSVAANTPDPTASININPADNGGNTDGNTPFTRTYPQGTVVTLSAEADSGTANFQQWLLNGIFHTTNRTTTVTLLTDTAVTAVYIPRITTNRVLSVTANTPDPTASININPADNGGNTDGNTPFTRTYPQGTVVTLSAEADSGTADFQQWLLNGAFYTTNRITTVTLLTDTAVTAVYIPRVTTNHVLTVDSITPDPFAFIDVNPADIGGDTSGNTTFTRTYLDGTLVTLVAPTNSGTANFLRWLRDGIFYSASRIAVIAMTTNVTMTAEFVPPPAVYTLTFRSVNPATGASISVIPPDISGDLDGSTVFQRIYSSGAVVTATATTNAAGNVFQKWQLDGVDLTTAPTTAILMNTNHTLTAVYVHMPGPVDPPSISPGGV